MRKSYKNELFNFIGNSEWDINDFEISESKGENFDVFTIGLKDSSMKFIARNPNSSFEQFECLITTFSPGYKIVHQNFGNAYSFDWLLRDFNIWLNNHLKAFIDEKNEIDLWEEFKKGAKELNISKIDFDDKNKFSIDEKIQIKLSINELKVLIHTSFNTSPIQQQLVDARLDYLIEASERLNKFDWKSVALSTIISITIALTLDVQQGHILFELFKKVFSAVSQITLGAG